MHELSSAGPMPCAFDPTRWGSKGRPYIQVHCKKKDVLREFSFLMSKISYEPKGLTEGEVIAVTELALRLDDMASRDRNYRFWLLPLIAIRPILEGLRPGESRATGLKGKFLMLDPPALELILGPYEYYGMKGNERPGHVKISWVYPKKGQSQTPRWMGVGYKDKGNLRIRARDGSPDWKEVAVDEKMRQKWRPESDWSMFNDPPQGIPYLRYGGTSSDPDESWKVILTTHRSEWYVI